jgi:hypothetical protein
MKNTAGEKKKGFLKIICNKRPEKEHTVFTEDKKQDWV